MKIKAIIVTLGLIITMFSGMGANYLKTTTNEVENQKTISSEEINTEDEVLEVEENKIEQEQEEIQQEQQAEVNQADGEIEVKQEEKKSIPRENPKTSSSQTMPNNQKENVSQETQTVPQTTQVQEEKKETVKPKEEIQAPKTITPSDLEYWCVSGGSHHVAGDGANEHGYYSSWDEAYQAFLNYTSGWSSVQFKISQCSCGLYYFWAIQ